MPWLRVPVVLCAAAVPVLAACGMSSPERADDRAPAGRVVVAPGAAGPAVPVVWRTGRDVLGSGLDGSGERRLLRLARTPFAAATPAPDGSRVAFVDGERLRVLTVGDGTIRDLGTVRDGDGILRWSPDGSRIAAVASSGLVVCDGAGGGCRRWTGRLGQETGATWSPDGRAVAVVRFPEPRRGDAEEQVLSVADGRSVRTVERFRASADGDRFAQPGAPVWTRAGLVFSALDLRLKDGELAGVRRARVRIRSGGRTRTLLSLPTTSSTLEPFAPSGETADGTLLGVRTRVGRTSSTFDLRTLVPGRTPQSARVPLGTFDPEMGNADAEVLGTLSDGRVAVAVRPVETAKVRLYLAVPGRGAGPVVRRADEVAVATPYPGNPVQQ